MGAWVEDGVNLANCYELTPRLRAEDLKELLAANPSANPTDLLIDSVAASHKSFSVIGEGVGCVAVFGVRMIGDVGVPWMLASELLFKDYGRVFIKQCKKYVHELVKESATSFNFVSVTNTETHRWLTWLGFSIDKLTVRTLNGVCFHPFTYTRKLNV